MSGIWWLPFLAVAAVAADAQYDLVGRFTPEARASVTLYGVASPFTTMVLTDDGRFTFRKLEQGAYTVAVIIPGHGEARQTIEVGPAGADAHHRVGITLNFKESDFEADVLRQQHSVPARQLAVSERAIHEYEDAQKDLARRDVESAVRRLQHAVELAPQFAMAWNNLGTIAYQTQKFARAEECFRASLEADPGAFEPLVNLGGVLINLNKLDEAWKYNVYAVLARPHDALANSQLGMTYLEQGQMDLAEKHLNEARRIDPGHFSHPQLFLAEIHLRRGQRRETAGDLEEFLKYHPDWPHAAAMREKIVELRQ